MTERLSANETFELLQDFKRCYNVSFIDLRNGKDLKRDGAMPGFMSVPQSRLSIRHFDRLEDGGSVICACDESGAIEVAKLAKSLLAGQERVRIMTNGFLGWKQSGLPIIHQVSPFVHLFYEKDTGTCQYVIVDEETASCAIVDPVLDYDLVSGTCGFNSPNKLLEFVAANSLQVKYILESHVHADHLTAASYLKSKLPGNPPICIGQGIVAVQQNFKSILGLSDDELRISNFDRLLSDQEILNLGSMEITVHHTPGHTPDGCSFLVGDSIFSGDSLFCPDVGSARCDFPDGKASQLYNSVKKLYQLNPWYKYFSAHDYPNARNTAFLTLLKHQMDQNIHLKEKTTEAEFVAMREKRDSGLNNPRLIYPALNFNINAGAPPVRGFVKVPVKYNPK